MEAFLENNWPWLAIVYIWSLAWKGWALWRSVERKDKVWFILLLIVNTVGLLEIVYIFYFSRQKSKESDASVKS